MEIKLHANATTTPRVRRYLQQSDKSDRELASELGISVTTVRRWRNREQVADRHTTPKVIHKAMRQEQIALVNALRDLTLAPLDELLQLVNDGLGIAVSRATLNRYLKPAKTARQGAPLSGKKALKAGLLPHWLTLHHLPLALSMDDNGEHHLLWAREPVSGWCFARLYAGISSQRVVNWLEEGLAACPAAIQSVETFISPAALAGLPALLAEKGITAEIQDVRPVTLAVTTPLVEIIPQLKAEPAAGLLARLCESYNNKAQKKLGGATPQAFLQALRREG
ncbi:XRE family transcriptional regulator [Enterobacter sp. PGRG2]|uniref:XRE family transcriptional regulator n=1 Tax=Enterobacter sp. PGRG2 TaxID=3104013 RepID=UPI002ABD1E24|nr:XRE family transcriptional regulator [Enterobacter sp. PGRG2]WJD49284.1 XRE family transcriptional regulator [Enterobacter sp. PGRG2]